MDETTEEPDDDTLSPTERLFGRQIPLERETLLFVVASALDVVMTWILLNKYHADGFVESNPIARFFLESWGPRGLVYFKFVMVAFVAVICQIIALKREDIARRILYFATALVACVVIYSFTLLVRYSSAVPNPFG
jgi:Domain of unknown function (DUF5658)